MLRCTFDSVGAARRRRLGPTGAARCIQHWSSDDGDDPAFLGINTVSFGMKAVSSGLNSDYV